MKGKKPTLIHVLVYVIATIVLAGGAFFLTRGKDESMSVSDSLQPGSTTRSIPGDGEYDYAEAPDHIGEKATVTGTVSKVFTSKSGTTFFDFCEEYHSCPFSAVIFSGDREKFASSTEYIGKMTISGLIRSYQGGAEIILNDPSQIIRRE